MTTLEPQIIFEDDQLLVVAKPAGMICNRADSVREPTLQDWLETRFAADSTWQAGREEDQEFFDRSGLGHRLDKDTSGVVIIGKTPAAMHFLLEQFLNHEAKKTYQALTHGYLPAPAGIIKAPISRDVRNRQRFTVTTEGRESSTIFRVVQEFAGIDEQKLRGVWLDHPNSIEMEKLLRVYQGFSLVSLQPQTGRTHQIRVHLKFLQHPIVGDARYNSTKRAYLDRQWCPRQWLHAAQLMIKHPVSGEIMTFTAPLPDDLQSELKLLLPR